MQHKCKWIRKKLVAGALGLCMLGGSLAFSTGSADAAIAGWRHNSSGYWYLRADGSYPTNTWEQISEKWYYFNAKGYMVTGWQQIGGKWYYFNTSGAMVTGWKQVGSKWYFFNTSGAMTTGWKQIKGKWYFFNTTGAMVTGWKQVKTNWYYFNTDGTMVTGSKTIDGKMYSFGSDGVCTEAPKACSHNWVWETHTEKEWVPPVTHQEPVYDDGWTEYVYKKMYKCGSCGKYFETIAEYEAHDAHYTGSYSKEKVIVDQIYHEPEIIDYATIIDVPGYWNEVVVKDYQYCSKCGKQK